MNPDWNVSFTLSLSSRDPLELPSSSTAALWSRIKIHRKNSHLIIDFPTSEKVSKVSERASRMEQANQWVVRANGRVSSPVLQSGFLIILAHSARRRFSSLFDWSPGLGNWNDHAAKTWASHDLCGMFGVMPMVRTLLLLFSSKSPRCDVSRFHSSFSMQLGWGCRASWKARTFEMWTFESHLWIAW